MNRSAVLQHFLELQAHANAFEDFLVEAIDRHDHDVDAGPQQHFGFGFGQQRDVRADGDVLDAAILQRGARAASFLSISGSPSR